MTNRFFKLKDKPCDRILSVNDYKKLLSWLWQVKHLITKSMSDRYSARSQDKSSELNWLYGKP